MFPRHPRAVGSASALLIAAALVTVALSGCANTVSLPAAARAASPGCADVTVRLPSKVAGLAKRPTNSQATAAWGKPADVILRCGVAPPGPTTLHCVDALGVDWVVEDADVKAIRYITFGRTPAVEVVLDHTKVSDATVLGDLTPAVTSIPQTRHCIGLNDTQSNPPTGTTAPSTATPSAPTPSAPAPVPTK